ncbi:S8 family serine peptidase [Sphingobacterium sp. N143]|uniref:S8 family peptidase n=1 Tax=Sphingobacterium sp. N143 TaxID=2746727 RepID=UPI002577371E|nr:S8 family serine peptidase [Sphingobacterium sp. N143]MDM1294435.1 S8 family serine peptidase [Sphingobacterium sp. N143]
MLHSFKISFYCLFLCFLFNSCKKNEDVIIPEPEPIKIIIKPDIVYLQRDVQFVGARLTVELQNLPEGESNEINWTIENTRIASLTQNAITKEASVWPEAAGETYVIATLANGKATAKTKIVVTDANDYKFRLILKDKGTSSHSIHKPETFLSQKAIQRRLKRNISIDDSDLPISEDYLTQIQQIGCKIAAKSKWLNTVTVHCEDYFLIDKYNVLPFVRSVEKVWEGPRMTLAEKGKYKDIPQKASNHSPNNHLDYGAAISNISVNNGQILHENGFKGAGIDIAVIDAGFLNLKNNPAFKNMNIKGAKSFVYENDDPYAVDLHGIWVTSCMAANQPGTYVGTAPEANYWLLRSEDQSSEHHIEEDYWVSAAEFADSVGVDIINSSLYYGPESFYNPPYQFEEMDGKTTFATRGANIAANKGIMIVNCAGNDRNWVGSPADSPLVLTVGSVNDNRLVSYFTSWGLTVDGRMKPDVMALGSSAHVIGESGTSETRSGTSYSSPIICGLVACLWQAYPQLSNKDLLDVIRKSGDRMNNPIIPYGYGIPDMKKAMEIAEDIKIFKKF